MQELPVLYKILTANQKKELRKEFPLRKRSCVSIILSLAAGIIAFISSAVLLIFAPDGDPLTPFLYMLCVGVLFVAFSAAFVFYTAWDSQFSKWLKKEKNIKR